jgi:hypothetical protein
MRRTTILLLAMLLAGCGNIGLPASLWPFGGDAKERSREPENATAYRCDGARKLYVRMLENGAAAWVILPERELRLEKSGASAGTNYSYRSTLLEIRGNEATLFEGPKPILTGCKTGTG